MRKPMTSHTLFGALSSASPPMLKLAPSPLPSTRASVSEYLQTKRQPPPAWHRNLHPTYDPDYPLKLVLSQLDHSTLLTLRLVSRQHKADVSKFSRNIFTNLRIEFPLTFNDTNQRHALEKLATQCNHLTITFPSTPLTTDLPLAEDSKPPLLPNLTHIHLQCPTLSTFERLHHFHQALQYDSRGTLPLLTHLTITSLNTLGITTLRSGAFTTFGSSTWPDKELWRKLISLDISLLPWWDTSHPSPGSSANKRERDIWRTGIKILHDWLASFISARQLRVLKFAWQGVEGPNPLLLDVAAATIEKGIWFPARPLYFTSLTDIWLWGVRVSADDVRHLEMRTKGLQVLMAEKRLVEKGVRGHRRVVQGRKWFQISLGKAEELVELEGDMPRGLEYQNQAHVGGQAQAQRHDQTEAQSSSQPQPQSQNQVQPRRRRRTPHRQESDTIPIALDNTPILTIRSGRYFPQSGLQRFWSGSS